MRVRTKTKSVEWEVMKCDFCGACVGVCPTDAITLWEADLEIDEERCTRCKRCVKICPYRALTGMDTNEHG